MSSLKFKVLVRGSNFRLQTEERGKSVIRQTGFYVWRCVHASDPVDAEYKAVEMVRLDPGIRNLVSNSPADPPLMFVEEIHQVESFEPLYEPGSGYTFFHGRGAGAPRKMRVLTAASALPKAIRAAVEKRWGRPRPLRRPERELP
jgi:hypothetical protein